MGGRGLAPACPKKASSVPRERRKTLGIILACPLARECARVRLMPAVPEGCYLVDPASSHMLVSKIKPCMCKYEQIQTVKLRMAH